MFKILIAEDDLELRQLFQHVLLKNGYTVKGVSDGQEALDALEKDYYQKQLSKKNMTPEKYILWLPPAALRKLPQTGSHRSGKAFREWM